MEYVLVVLAAVWLVCSAIKLYNLDEFWEKIEKDDKVNNPANRELEIWAPNIVWWINFLAKWFFILIVVVCSPLLVFEDIIKHIRKRLRLRRTNKLIDNIQRTIAAAQEGPALDNARRTLEELRQACHKEIEGE